MSFTAKIKDVLIISSANFGAAIIYGMFWFFLAAILGKSEYEPKGQNVFPASFTITLISSIVAGILTFLITKEISLSFLIVGMSLFFIVLSGLNSKHEFRKYALHVLIRAGLSAVLSILLYYILGITGILFGYFIASFIIIIELRSFIKNKKIEFSYIKSKINFVVQVWSTRLAGVLFWWGDKIIIGSILGFSMLGSYHFAAQYLLLITTIPRTLNQYLIPYEAKGGEHKKIKIFSILIACLIILISLFAVPIAINTILPTYVDSILPIQIMSIAIIPLTISSIQESEFLGKENSRNVLVGSIFQTGTYFLFIIFLGQLLGLTGIAIGFLAASIIRIIVNLVTNRFSVN